MSRRLLLEELELENRLEVKKIIRILESAQIDDQQKENVIDDVIEMALAAQSRGEPFVDVIENDPQKFLDSIFNQLHELPKSTKILRLIGYACLAYSVIVLTTFILSLVMPHTDSRFFVEESTVYQTVLNFIGDLFTALVVFVMLNQILKNRTIKHRKETDTKQFLIAFVSGVVLYFIVRTVVLLIMPNANEKLLTFNLPIFLIVYISFLIIGFVLSRWGKRK